MPVGVIHPLPARELIYLEADRQVTVDDGDARRWGPWFIQGYAWITGTIYIPAGGDDCALDIYQGFHFGTAALGGIFPPGSWWRDRHQFIVVPGTCLRWKIIVFSQGVFLNFTNNSGAQKVVDIDCYSRND